MATLTINGREVTVDDSFLSLSPEQQDATVDEIAASMGSSQPAQPAPAAMPPRQPLQPVVDEGESWSPGQVEPAQRPVRADVAASLVPKGELTPRDITIGDRLYDAAKAVGMPASQMRRDLQNQAATADSAVRGIADTVMLGGADEFAAGMGALTGIGGKAGDYDNNLRAQRQLDKEYERTHGGARMLGQLAGGLALGVGAGGGKLAAKYLGPSLGAIAEATALGGGYGFGSGEGFDNRLSQAGWGALIGGGLTAGPLAALGGGRWISKKLAGKAAEAATGVSPDALRALGDILERDGSLTETGRANMARAGQEAMLVDAGPAARGILDDAIQQQGRAGLIASERIGARVGRDSKAFVDTLDSTLGAPEGITAARSSIREGTAAARGNAYDRAYEAAIDYSDPRAMGMERLLLDRVPKAALDRANQLMQLEGAKSRQLMARVADDGSRTFETMPDVRQIDYVTRALNDLATSGEGQGALGGQTAVGRAYKSLSGEIRDNLRGLVPQYDEALATAADPIRRSQAVEFGGKLLSPSTTRDQVAEQISGMTKAERQALAQGIRSSIDDTMARVTRTVADGDVDAREAIKGLKDLSSRANREKIQMAIGDEAAERLFGEADRVAQSFDLRGSVAGNSRTYGRKAINQRLDDITAPGVAGTLAKGEVRNAGQRIIQALTRQTPEHQLAKKDALRAQIVDLLTRQGGAGEGVYKAITQLGKKDAASRLIGERIALALSPKLVYPALSQFHGDRGR